MYKKIIGIDGTVRNDAIKRLVDNAVIPLDKANTDYQEYLKWVAKGNKAIEVDEA